MLPFLYIKTFTNVTNIPLVTCCLVGLSFKEHAGSSDCSLGSTTPTVRRLLVHQSHTESRRFGRALSGQLPPWSCHAVTGSDPNDGQLSDS